MLKKVIQRYAVAFGMAAAMFAAGAGGIQRANAAEIARDIYKYYFGNGQQGRVKKQQQHYCLQVQMEVMINDVLSQIQVQKDSGSTC